MGFGMQPQVCVNGATCPSGQRGGKSQLSSHRNWCHKFLRDAGFYLTPRNLSTIQVELISGCMDCLLELEGLEFPLDLTPSNTPALDTQVP